ncbi:hypothetical protein HN51_068657 [Arachis hypogaea]|uniref:Uncharacterized protein n=1 Tax=Arachis hypogaea TaxID=3818 RepID=A0A444Z9G4_ARAHY|nr:uncharacterized protein LOC112749470 [Arachis hypogaea]XP_025653506.1 uncharacterized protein LOC112749470 [Arachis hypogaea]QHO10751.1 uncharacterized protein DS421_15g492300 [Arachis hypogaea]RYR10815.1 hypothetical protein Ahy_B05g079301 isoform A [Arachis hypogaea]RYR10816.1 hypothetical protein Ahy_B05g079301 isoform B [Arachis hypogaea]
MPTFSAIALDRLLEPGGSRPVDRSASNSMPLPNSQKGRNASAPPKKKKATRPPLKPALYATPEVTPLPDAPSSFPPSPYIINHKRRGPRLLKSTSEASILAEQNVLHDCEKPNGKSSDTVVVSSAGDLQVPYKNPEAVKEELGDTVYHFEFDSSNNGDFGTGHRESGSSSITNDLQVPTMNSQRGLEIEDFFDPNESMSFASITDVEDNAGAELSMKYSSPGEFFDAWEELSSEGGTQNSTIDFEAELREMRLSLLMEIEKRKQTEESLNSMKSQYERIRQGLYSAGIVLPANLTAVAGADQLNSDPMEDLCQQVHVARFISNSIGRGMARAEVEAQMEAQLDLKNFEIARLLERLRCYETMNREMVQRNQEAIELGRRDRQRRRRRMKRWVWSSITSAIVLGSAAIAWSYLPTSKGSSSSADLDVVAEHEDAAAK